MSPSASSSSQDQQAQQPPKSVIPTHRRVTEQLTKHWAPFKALRQRYAGTHFEEQRQLRLPQKHKATVQDSTLRVEMNALEEQADNAKARELLWKPLSRYRALRRVRRAVTRYQEQSNTGLVYLTNTAKLNTARPTRCNALLGNFEDSGAGTDLRCAPARRRPRKGTRADQGVGSIGGGTF